MKNVLKLSLLTAGIALSSSVIAQEAIKSDAKTTATQLETPKPTESKQDPVKKDSGSGSTTSTSSKTDSAVDTTATGGGTRMAISEQGTPKKNKNKKSKTAAPPTEAPKK